MDLSVINVCQLKTCWGCLYCCFSWYCESCWFRFGSCSFVIKLNFCSDFKHKVWSRFWSWSSGEILKLNFCQYFDADFLLKLWSWIMVKIRKPALVIFLNFKFVRDGWDFEVGAWSRFWKWKLIKICVRTTQPSGPLCLGQCCNIKKSKKMF